ncbi:MAG: glutathione S-transferase family protein [Synechococcaceae cyanobacterium SM2_3_60]|nr:glutathione S-transferase family protein [Synechococcaceae cyanobacterium SM2_3_60]
MIMLYGVSAVGASIVQWYLEELGQPYTFEHLDLQQGEQHQEAFLQINPMGKVPAIVDGEFCLWESGAILLYLAEVYSPGGETAQARAELAQWVIYANATLAVGLFVEANRQRDSARLLRCLDGVLGDGLRPAGGRREFLVNDCFSVADVAVGAILIYALKMLTGMCFHGYPSIEAYVSRLSNRPAFERSIG